MRLAWLAPNFPHPTPTAPIPTAPTCSKLTTPHTFARLRLPPPAPAMSLSDVSNLPPSRNPPARPDAFFSKPSQPEVVVIPTDELPAAEEPSGMEEVALAANDCIHAFAAVPESGLLATVSHDALRIYSVTAEHVGGDGGLLHSIMYENGGDANYLWVIYYRIIASLGGDVLVWSEPSGILATGRATTGERLETIIFPTVNGNSENAVVICAIGDAEFVVGTKSGHLVFYSHTGGSNLLVLAQESAVHAEVSDRNYQGVSDISAHGDTVVAISGGRAAAVWSVRTHKLLAVLKPGGLDLMHGDTMLRAAAVCERFIAIGLSGGSIRIFLNGEGYELSKVLKGVHDVGFVSSSL